tara:strand:+ start:192 stop:359 length:168 start_codon:yes stop_codon:yes gene_type:complete
MSKKLNHNSQQLSKKSNKNAQPHARFNDTVETFREVQTEGAITPLQQLKPQKNFT